MVATIGFAQRRRAAVEAHTKSPGSWGSLLASIWRIRTEAPGQVLKDPLTINANETTVLNLGVEGERFVISR